MVIVPVPRTAELIAFPSPSEQDGKTALHLALASDTDVGVDAACCLLNDHSADARLTDNVRGPPPCLRRHAPC